MASMRVRRAATRANSAATKKALASTSSTTASRRRPSDSEGDAGIEAGTYPVVTRLQAPPYTALAPHLPQFGRFGGADPETVASVRAILDDVRARGDAGVRDQTRRLDDIDLAPREWEVPVARCQEALERLPSPLVAALEIAAARVRDYHARQVERGFSTRDADGTELGMQVVPLERVGVYVPGGKAAYPSTVLMSALPARVAGVGEIIMVVPTPNGERNPLVLAAAAIAGVDRVFTIGGSQAIAALAYGTATIPAVDKITGPGNAYVAAAKRRVFGTVGIDMIAGPSEILVLCDGTTDPDWVAMDLFSQAE